MRGENGFFSMHSRRDGSGHGNGVKCLRMHSYEACGWFHVFE